MASNAASAFDRIRIAPFPLRYGAGGPNPATTGSGGRVYRLFAAVWSWWDAAETKSLFDRRDYRFFSPPFVALLMVLAVATGTSIGLMTSLDVVLLDLAARDHGILAIRQDFWKGIYGFAGTGLVPAASMTIIASCAAGMLATLVHEGWVWRRWPPRAVALIPMAAGSVFASSATGWRLIERVYDYGASGPLGRWLARSGNHLMEPEDRLLDRGRRTHRAARGGGRDTAHDRGGSHLE